MSQTTDTPKTRGFPGKKKFELKSIQLEFKSNHEQILENLKESLGK